MTNTGGTPAGWYHAPGDPEATQRYWDGGQWIGDPQPSQQSAPQQAPPPSWGEQPPSGASSSDQPSFGQSAPPSFGQQPPPGAGSPPPGAPPGYVAYGQAGTPVSNLASPGQRIGARAIDWVLWFVISLVVGLIFGAGVFATGGDDVSLVTSALAGLVGGAIIIAYEVFMVSSRGATLGKMALSLKVVNEDGSDPDTKDAVMRISPYIAAVVLGIIPILNIISGFVALIVVIVSLVFLFTDDRRQAVWDKIAKTLVVTS